MDELLHLRPVGVKVVFAYGVHIGDDTRGSLRRQENAGAFDRALSAGSHDAPGGELERVWRDRHDRIDLVIGGEGTYGVDNGTLRVIGRQRKLLEPAQGRLRRANPGIAQDVGHIVHMRAIELQRNGLALQIIWRADGWPHRHGITASAPGELDDDNEVGSRRLEHFRRGVDYPHRAAQVWSFTVEHRLDLLGEVILETQRDIQSFRTEEAFLHAIDQAHVTTPGNHVDELRTGFDRLEAWRDRLAERFRFEVFDLVRCGLRAAHEEQREKYQNTRGDDSLHPVPPFLCALCCHRLANLIRKNCCVFLHFTINDC